MAVDAAPGAVREIMVVLALAATGLLLAVIAVLATRVAGSTRSGRDVVIEMQVPGAPGGADLAAGRADGSGG